MTGRLRAALAVLAVGLAACAEHDRSRSDWEDQNAPWLAKVDDPAGTAPLPPYPRAEDLIEFPVEGVPAFRFYVAASSVAVSRERDGVIRYVLVARSSAGAENVSYEGLNCRSGEYRSYASGHSGAWRRQEAAWRPIAHRRAQRTLMHEFFCPRHVAIADAAEGVMALRRGRHPLVINPNPVGGGGR